jgi:hypothetical protein
MKPLLIIAIFLLLAASITAQAQVTKVRVSQESAPGAADFDSHVLGYIDVFSRTTKTPADVYHYNVPNGSSYNGWLFDSGLPEALSGVSQLFLVDTSQGLSLFVVHDRPNDGTGGHTEMRFDLSGNTSTAIRQVEDDPDDAGRPGNTSGPTLFQTNHYWEDCCTDGVVIGALSGPWSLLAQFTDVDGNAGTPAFSGIDSWAATSASGSGVTLNLAEGRRVRLDQAALSVAIDIKPGGYPNSINLGSNGTVPVAILSTATFDARTVDPSTITLAGASVALKGKGTLMYSFEDVSGDGLLDLVVHVSTEALQLSDSDTMAVLTGKTYGGVLILGTDTIRVVP